MHDIIKAPNVSVPVVDHELLHSQQGVVADELVLVVHVIHHQLFSTQLLNHPEIGGMRKKPLSTQTTRTIFMLEVIRWSSAR